MAILSITEKSSGEVVARHTVFKRVTTLGSAPDCDVVVNDPAVESLHAMLVLEGATFMLNRGPDVRHIEINGQRKRKAILQHTNAQDSRTKETQMDREFDSRGGCVGAAGRGRVRRSLGLLCQSYSPAGASDQPLWRVR